LRARLENVEVIKSRVSLLKVELEASSGLLAWYQSQDASRNAELSRIGAELAVANQFRRRWEEGKSVVVDLYAQVSAYRSSRMARYASLLTRKDMLWESVSPAFFDIKAYTAQHFRRASRSRLVLGDDLAAMSYREYAIPFELKGLSRVSLAIRPLLHVPHGTVGVEIVSKEQRVVAQVSLSVSGISPDAPTDFIMPAPLADIGEGWALRVFVRDVGVPVAIYELVEYSAFRREIHFMPFVLLQ